VLRRVPRASPRSACFAAFRVIAGDGKRVKDAAKRLMPARGLGGKLVGAKALVAMDVRTGLAVAMSDSLDGAANDCPLVPALVDQLRALTPDAPLLSVWDRQFGAPTLRRLLAARPGDAYLVRLRKGLRFTPDAPAAAAVTDEVGLLGTGANAVRVRRVTLRRGNGGGGGDAWPRAGRRSADDARVRLGELLRGAWKRSYAKASDRRPRTKPPPTHRIHGGHTSVQRLLDGAARLIKL
jgi:hypothetical protein